ncbi:hypothetical protein CHS0354_000666 [Potamilus streckersoni]|uniref:Uncharacterized protein n=1 Tax=Potamilus streckersoni TaxID=2493646 RepID=A0AAE0T770_9BIVA|nr:hypothetical protein CHS0354_000666 [Potamilus streckersoni]
MSDQELKHIVASLAISIKEVSAQIKELSASQKKTDEQIKELFASQKKTDAQQKKTDAQQKKTDAQQKKTDEQIKELSASQKKTDEQIKELSVEHKKTEKLIKELSASQKKTDEQIKELFASQKKTDEQIKELSVEHKKTESTLKGLGFNVGMAVEEYFYNSLDLTKKVANIQFDDCQKNLHGFNRELKLQDEFDITMANTTKGLLVECKHHVVKEDVVKLRERKVKNLKILYPDFKDLEMYLAVAGASFDLDAKQEAKQSGIIILKQVDMSDRELKDLVASLAVSIKELSASQKRTDAQQKKTDKQIKELSASQKETDEQIKELFASQKKTDEQIKELSASQKETDAQQKKTESTLKGLGFNVGMAVEEYFYNSLERTKKVANIQFDDCQKNLHGFNKKLKLQDEFDITMTNTTKGLLVECKHHVVKEDVVKLRESKVKNLKILYPDFKDLEMYLAVAGASFDSDAKQEAKQSGIIILKQVGDVMEEEVENLKTY